MLLLSDVETKNGPMIVIKKSNQLFCKSMKFYNKISSFLRCFPNFNSNHLQYNSSDIYNKENIVELKGKAGDLFIIDTRMVHRAGVMKDGNRQVLWNYFS
jgi:ectoine hydroxylase-related dioxygenase (phytanoyl-CoA dioxygenase family)